MLFPHVLVTCLARSMQKGTEGRSALERGEQGPRKQPAHPSHGPASKDAAAPATPAATAGAQTPRVTATRRAGPKQAGWLFDLQMKAPHKGIHPVASCRATGRPLGSTPCPHSLVSKTLLNELPFTGQRWVRTPAPASPVCGVFVSSSACSSSAGPCLPPVPPYREEQR